MTSLTPAQTEELREAIRRAVAKVPGAFVGPLMNPLVAELKPVVEGLLASAEPAPKPLTAPRPTLTDLTGPPPADEPVEHGPLHVAFWSNDEEKIVVRVVDSLDVELTEWCEDEDAPLHSADVLVAFGDVSDERLEQLAYWAHMQLEEDLVAYAGPVSMHTWALDGIEGVIDSQVARTGDPREDFLPPAELMPTSIVDQDAPADEIAFLADELGFPKELIDMMMAEESSAPVNPHGIEFVEPARPTYTPIEGGPGTTAPFAVILTDPGDWPYNNAYVSDDAALLHRIEHDQSMPRDEVLMAVSEQMTSVGDHADSEGQWWASVNKALDERGIPEDRRHEGIYY